jgi:AraC family transcriptional regulator, positive regulator of tynA and feaB
MPSISTDAVKSTERDEFWTDIVSRHVTPIQIEPTGSSALRGEIHAIPVGAAAIAQVSGQGMRALHTRAHVARGAAHLHAACVHLHGETRIERHGTITALQPGDIFITDSREEFTLDLGRPWRHLVIALPTDWLDTRRAGRKKIAGAVIRNSPLARLWAGHLSAAFAQGGCISQAAATMFVRHSVELLVELLDETDAEHLSQTDAWRRAVYLHACQLIAFRYAEAGLNPEHIARAIGISSRTLMRIFAANKETIMQRVLDERIRQAAKLLTAPVAANRSVTEIALICGFNDVSHFGRSFAARMHATPTEWRRRMSSLEALGDPGSSR